MNYLNNEPEFKFVTSYSYNIAFDEMNLSNKINKDCIFDNNIFDFEDINIEDYYFNDKRKIEYSHKNNLKINETSSQTNPSKIKVKITKRGRKLKISGEKRYNNKKTFDNVLRRIKHSLLKELRILINNKIKDVYKDNKKFSSLEILKLDQKQANNSNISFNKIFFYKSIKEIFSNKLTTKYKSKKNKLDIYNELIIEKLLNQQDIEKRNIFENIFNLKFIDVVNYIVGKRNDLIQLNGLSLTKKLLYEMSIDKEYSDAIIDTKKNLEKILKDIKIIFIIKNNYFNI